MLPKSVAISLTCRSAWTYTILAGACMDEGGCCRGFRRNRAAYVGTRQDDLQGTFIGSAS